MAKRRTKRAADRARRKTQKLAGMKNPKGKSKYAKKREYCSSKGVDPLEVSSKDIWGGSNELRRPAWTQQYVIRWVFCEQTQRTEPAASTPTGWAASDAGRPQRASWIEVETPKAARAA